MDIALTIGFVTTAVTLLVTVVLFALDRLLTRRAAQAEVRRQLVAGVLDTLDRSARSLARPVFVRLWTSAEIEFVLLTPRLLLDLGRKDRVIVVWLQRQVQLMQLSTRRVGVLTICTSTAEKVLQWHHGEINARWFAAELKADPMVRQFTVPKPVKAKRLIRDSWSWAQFFGLLALIAVFVRQIMKSARGTAA